MRLALLLLLAVAALPARAQAPDTLAGRYTIAGAWESFDALAADLRPGSVVFLGETHDDAVGHVLQQRLLAAVAARQPVVLALEMFETDVQGVLDEYLAGVITERDMLAAARPWGNYATDYRPLVEVARERGFPVIAANAPARYVRLVTRSGLDALARLTPEARATMPPVVAPPTDALAGRFVGLMTEMGAGHGGGGPTPEAMLVGQNLRDATMAWAVARARAAHPGAVVVHVNGSFHSDRRQGIPEHLARLAPDAHVVVVSMGATPDAEGADLTVATR